LASPAQLEYARDYYQSHLLLFLVTHAAWKSRLPVPSK
jgi:hypothetical protein